MLKITYTLNDFSIIFNDIKQQKNKFFNALCRFFIKNQNFCIDNGCWLVLLSLQTSEINN